MKNIETTALEHKYISFTYFASIFHFSEGDVVEVPHEAHGDGVAPPARRTHRRHDAYVHQGPELADVLPVVPA